MRAVHTVAAILLTACTATAHRVVNGRASGLWCD
jgi:outer membrane biogenesis lipoprotein LolB